jgi:putative MATE family efflux protein
VVTELHARATDGSASPTRAVLGLGLPLVVGALSSLMSSVIDTAMMGHYGTVELAAVSAASAVFDIFSNIVVASVVAYQILAPRLLGAGHLNGLRRAWRSSLWYCGGLALLLTVVTVTVGGTIAGTVAGGDQRIVDLADEFLRARAPSLLLLVPFGLLTATFNAQRRSRYTMVAGLGISAVNLVLDWLLIYGPGPLPALGVVGNGLATTVSWAMGTAWLAVSARSGPLARTASTDAVPDVDFDTSVPRLAWPAIVSTAVDYISLALFFAIIGRGGESALAAGRIGSELDTLSFGVLVAFAAAVRILVGRAIGAGDIDGCAQLWRVGRRTLLVAVLPVAALLVLDPTGVLALFTSYRPVVDAGTRAVLLVGLGLPAMAWCIGSTSMLKALGQTRSDMYANLGAVWLVQLPVAALAAHAKLGVTGAFFGLLGYWLARASVSAALARRAFQRTVRQKDRQP